MGCGHHKSYSTDNCVCAVLREIARVQDIVSPDTNGDCTVSCERSIQELLNGVSPATTRPNTIPVILYCDCEVFKGVGVGLNESGKFECVNTILFRVNAVDENCCATLELLRVSGTMNSHKICEVLNSKGPEDIEGTGICITVDLNCFCAVTCLDPIRL